MKHISLFFAALFIAGLSVGQERSFHEEHQTLGNGKSALGMFVGLTTKASEINDQFGTFSGAELSFVFNHKLNFGFVGYGMMPSIASDYIGASGNPYYLDMGYGGMKFEPVIGSKNVVHVTFPIVLGAGVVGHRSNQFWDAWDNDFDAWEVGYTERDLFYVAEPGVNAELNIFKVLRLAAGVNYRFIGDANLANTDNTDLQGWNANLTLKMGWF